MFKYVKLTLILKIWQEKAEAKQSTMALEKSLAEIELEALAEGTVF